ncbi:uncharacterized protein A4U43_C07F10670 [Asparagus officinalis]|uniref:Uncharacterized protein n=1 Tax=Asparagus officinalis TaxID=4686 RepID=A0A5P1EG34_ASPOF|nr:uncharacterized protein A4U43_C07F10670 [Asparagus officinalis]
MFLPTEKEKGRVNQPSEPLRESVLVWHSRIMSFSLQRHPPYASIRPIRTDFFNPSLHHSTSSIKRSTTTKQPPNTLNQTFFPPEAADTKGLNIMASDNNGVDLSPPPPRSRSPFLSSWVLFWIQQSMQGNSQLGIYVKHVPPLWGLS